MTITAVLDTADWRLAVPVEPVTGLAPDFIGSRLAIVLTPILGGAPVAEADSIDGGLTFVPALGGLPAYLALDSRAADRTWRIARPTTVAGDILRYVDPSAVEPCEWLGRITLRILPGSNSPAIAMAAQTPVLVDAQPYDGRIQTAPLYVGPQGPRGPGVVLPPLPGDAASKTYSLASVNGILTWV